ncbi:2'-5'-oligoadenylate synthase 1 isoform X1 [Oryctolagus cuniculus]|uniref:2'-5'-oligoadenylate synthase 1 isoform X1 n=1 Tax=Oryctolagus cuniculus TaxID=9986 RepID=UPI00387A345E
MATCSRMELANTPARFLDKFIEDHLLPDTRFREQVREAVDIICTFLKERCFRGATHRVRVSKVVKGGSSGKGTALRGRSDADLVVFLTNLTSFHEQLEKRREFIREIRSQLKACQREKMFEVTFALTQRSNPRVLSFELRSLQRQQQVEFDVLPAFDALGHVTRGYRPRPQVYVDLIEECTALGKEGEFSTCFTELQRAFLKQRPTKLKSLIRLVKHWYQRACDSGPGRPHGKRGHREPKRLAAAGTRGRRLADSTMLPELGWLPGVLLGRAARSAHSCWTGQGQRDVSHPLSACTGRQEGLRPPTSPDQPDVSHTSRAPAPCPSHTPQPSSPTQVPLPQAEDILRQRPQRRREKWRGGRSLGFASLLCAPWEGQGQCIRCTNKNHSDCHVAVFISFEAQRQEA